MGGARLAYDYPLLGLFWTFLYWFIWIAWIMVVFRVFVDIFRSHDLGGWGKALWSLFVLLVPFLGVFVYLIARGGSMNRRDMEEAQQREDAFRGYARDVAGSGGPADELSKLAELRDRGVISDDEFERTKHKLLA